MGYTEGMAIAEAFVKRNDGWFGKKKAKCDPRYGWKTGAGGKCVRVSPEEDPNKGYGTNVFLTDTDKDLIESQIGGSKFIDSYTEFQPGRSRKESVMYARDAARLFGQQADGADFNKEIASLNRFATARESGDRSLKNQYGTSQFVSSSEARWIDSMGGTDSIKLPKEKAVAYLKDAYMTSPIFTGSQERSDRELSSVNKHYFGDK